MSIVLLPLLAITTIAIGSVPGNPAWLRYGGYAMLVILTPIVLILLGLTFTGRVRFTSDVLSVSSLGRRVDLRRGQVQAITPRTVARGITGQPTLHFDLAYTRPSGGRDATGAVYWLDTQCSVEAADLLAALKIWYDRDPTDPTLIDRIDAKRLRAGAAAAQPDRHRPRRRRSARWFTAALSWLCGRRDPLCRADRSCAGGGVRAAIAPGGRTGGAGQSCRGGGCPRERKRSGRRRRRGRGALPSGR